MNDLFYKTFEEKYRGSRELIKSRLKVYLPFIQPMLQFYPKGALLDLGCGRGEWLELTAEIGFQSQGVDLDEGMLQNARELGLSVKKIDALAFLKQLPDNSQTIVSGFHIAEHMIFEQLQQLVEEAKRVLVAGGLLILETPNPENLMVGTNNFYLDPTHQRPLPPDLLHFLPEYYGFARQKIIRLQEPPHLLGSSNTSLMDVMGGVSPDYSVIAQKAAAADVLQAFDTPFHQEYGLTLNTLTDKFQQNLMRQLDIAESAAKSQLLEALQIAQTAQAQMQESIARADKAETLANQRLQQINALYRSKSWRITSPLRWFMRSILLKDAAKTAHQEQTPEQEYSDFSSISAKDSVPLASHSVAIPPYRVFSKILIGAWIRLQNYPWLRAKLMRVLRIFPAIEYRLRRIYQDSQIKKHAPASLWHSAKNDTQFRQMQMGSSLDEMLFKKNSRANVFPSPTAGINASQRSPLEAYLAD